MAEADLSKIVSLIMENPHIIDEIKKLTEEPANSNSKSDVSEEPLEMKEEISEESPLRKEAMPRSKRRRELLSALMPYVSDGRGQAIESMMTIADIIDAMGRK